VADLEASAVRFLMKVVMPSPFPGMDPYLENPEIFPDVHDSLITYLRESIQANLPAPYFAVLGRRLWIEVSRRSIGPDVEVRHAPGPSERVPKLGGSVGIVSVPRAQPIVVKVAHDELREPFFDYHVSVHGFEDVETFFVYPIRLEDRLPPIEIPLLPGDSSVTIDLQAVFDRCYDAGPYAREIRYGEDAVIPPLQDDKAAWAALGESGRQ
jgi:hypothetical protein